MIREYRSEKSTIFIEDTEFLLLNRHLIKVLRVLIGESMIVIKTTKQN